MRIQSSVKIDATPQLATSLFSRLSDTLNDDDPDLTSTNTLLAKNGEAIYFDFETNERIESPSVTINGVSLECCDGCSDAVITQERKWRAPTPRV